MSKETYMTPGQIADHLGISVESLNQYSKTHSIPHVQTPGGHRRYLLSEIETAFAEIAAKRERGRLAHLTTHLPESLFNQVRETATAEHRSMAAVVRDAVESYFAQGKTKTKTNTKTKNKR